MKKRKILSAVLAAAMAFGLLGASAGAAAAQPDASVENLAYMDLESAPIEMWDDILAARAEIIYSGQAWTVDGAVSIVHADGTVEALPEFYDLFPADWNVPGAALPGFAKTSCVSLARSGIGYSANVSLFYQETSSPFYRFNANGNTVYAWAYTLPSGMDSCNIGFGNEDTGRDLGWYPGLPRGEQAILNTVEGVRYSVRASSGTPGVSGMAKMVVSEDPNYIPSIQG